MATTKARKPTITGPNFRPAVQFFFKKAPCGALHHSIGRRRSTVKFQKQKAIIHLIGTAARYRMVKVVVSLPLSTIATVRYGCPSACSNKRTKDIIA